MKEIDKSRKFKSLKEVLTEKELTNTRAKQEAKA